MKPVATVEPLTAEGKAMPGNCRRVLNTFLPPTVLGYCEASGVKCAGLQRDGSCLAQIVMAAWDQGKDWRFEVNKDASGTDWWDYVGEPLAPFEPRYPDNVPLPPPPEPTHFEFTCPHCGNQEVFPLGFYWCSACGKNANDP